MARRRQNLHNKATFVIPSQARYLLVQEEVSDYEYVECEELPNLDHGVIWAHSLGASPPDLFGEMLALIEIKAQKAKDAREFKPLSASRAWEMCWRLTETGKWRYLNVRQYQKEDAT